ncbi:MAG TPA: ornithine carbamoyltransferase [Candidatus Binatia bacterium]|nr:ornithine carbamoyltransferase [Candidatus Binatia bacterium]
MSQPTPAAASRASFSAAELVSDQDLSSSDLALLLEAAAHIRTEPAAYRQSLQGRTLVLLFEKPSLRTRVTFEVAMKGLGGDAIYYDCRSEPLGQRETVADVARNLERWVDCIAARTFRQSTVEELAHWAKIPVINALSDRYHPCQALADILTVKDVFGRLMGIKLAYVGDGNNVAHSLLLTGAKAGLSSAVATPPSYEPDPEIVRIASEIASQTGGSVQVGDDPAEAVAGAHVVYTDVWASMGSEQEAETRRQRFAPFRVTEGLFSKARSEAIFLHCLPAHRGEEVEAAVIDSPRSAVFHQAENRLHAQKALLWLLLAQGTAKDGN